MTSEDGENAKFKVNIIISLAYIKCFHVSLLEERSKLKISQCFAEKVNG